MRLNRPKFEDNPLSGSTTLDLPSNLLQYRKSAFRQFRTRYASGTRNVSPRQFTTEVQFFKKQKQPLFIEQKTENTKKNALYKRLSHIQVQNKQLTGISFSKLLSRMIIIDQKIDYGAKYTKDHYPQSKIRSIPNYQTIKSKVYQIQCPQKQTKSPNKSLNLQKLSQPSAKLFRKYYMPNGEKASNNSSNYSTIECDDKYIYKNGKKAQCKRIHNFYTSQNFRKGFQKQLRRTQDSFFNTSIQKASQTLTLSNSRYGN